MFIALSKVWGDKWAYLFVILSLVWPSKSWIIRIETPFIARCEAKVWRRACHLIRFTLAKSHIRWIFLVARWSFKALPSSSAKTNPLLSFYVLLDFSCIFAIIKVSTHNLISKVWLSFFYLRIEIGSRVPQMNSFRDTFCGSTTRLSFLVAKFINFQ